MGWRLGLFIGFVVAAAALVACGGGCGGGFHYTTTVEAGATSCVVTLSNADASLMIAVGDMPADAGCGPTDPNVGVSCTSAQISSRLVCLRGCDSFSVIGDGVDEAQARAVLGQDAAAPVAASVTCNGTPVPSAPKQALTQECAL